MYYFTLTHRRDNDNNYTKGTSTATENMDTAMSDYFSILPPIISSQKYKSAVIEMIDETGRVVRHDAWERVTPTEAEKVAEEINLNKEE